MAIQSQFKSYLVEDAQKKDLLWWSYELYETSYVVLKVLSNCTHVKFYLIISCPCSSGLHFAKTPSVHNMCVVDAQPRYVA